MLALKQNGVTLYSVLPGSAFNLPDGSIVSPAYVGWTGGDGFELVPQDPPTPPAMTAEDYAAAIDDHVEATARARQYNGAAHLASYIASTVPAWSAEATAFVAWRDQVWLHAFTVLAAMQSTETTAPSIDEVLSSLPQIVWPT